MFNADAMGLKAEIGLIGVATGHGCCSAKLVCFEAFAILDPKFGLLSCQRAGNICLKICNKKILVGVFLENL